MYSSVVVPIKSSVDFKNTFAHLERKLIINKSWSFSSAELHQNILNFAVPVDGFYFGKILEETL